MIAPATYRPTGRWSGLIALLAAVVAVMVCVPYADARTRAYAVMDFDTGAIIRAVNEDVRLHPASLTKMMTLYLVFEAVRSGRLSLDQKVRISKRAASMPPTRLGLRNGQRVLLRHLVASAAVRSANDAAVALAELVAGSEAAFAKRMTAKARRMGMRNTTFRNATGFTAKGHLSTARDMAILGRRLIRDFPEHYATFKRRHIRWGGRRIRATNSRFLNAYRGSDGVKTGYTRAAGYTMVASAKRSGKRLVASYFGASSSYRRARRISQILDQGFLDIRNGGIQRVARVEPPAPRAVAPPQQAPLPITRVSATADPIPAPGAAPSESDAPKEVVRPAFPSGGWSIQVGAYAKESQAKAYLERVAKRHAGAVAAGKLWTPRQRRLYLARFHGYDKDSASLACKKLRGSGVDCLPIASSGPPSSVAVASAVRPAPTGPDAGRWSVQVGAFRRKSQATAYLDQVAAKHAVAVEHGAPTTPKRRRLYLARFGGFDQQDAERACARLRRAGVDCFAVLSGPEPAASGASQVAAAAPAGAPSSQWLIQVGAYRRASQAQARLDGVRAAGFDWLTGRPHRVPKSGRNYLSQFLGFDEAGARDACAELQNRGIDCLPVRTRLDTPVVETTLAAADEPPSVGTSQPVRPETTDQALPTDTWLIQVGAYRRAAQARARINGIRAAGFDWLTGRPYRVPKSGRNYLSQFLGFDEAGARNACADLQSRSIDCLPVRVRSRVPTIEATVAATAEPISVDASQEAQLPNTVRSGGADAWLIQVGAYRRAAQARGRINGVRAAGFDWLAGRAHRVPKSGRNYLSQFLGFDEAGAREACAELERRGIDCLPVKSRSNAKETEYTVTHSTGETGASAASRPSSAKTEVASTAAPAWSIQVGTFRRAKQAKRELRRVMGAEIAELQGTRSDVNKMGRRFVSRFSPFTQESARAACRKLKARRFECLEIAPRPESSYTASADAAWAIQVGAYRKSLQAKAQLDRIGRKSIGELAGARHWVPKRGGLYLARFRNLDESAATAACNALKVDGVDCLKVALRR